MRSLNNGNEPGFLTDRGFSMGGMKKASNAAKTYRAMRLIATFEVLRNLMTPKKSDTKFTSPPWKHRRNTG